MIRLLLILMSLLWLTACGNPLARAMLKPPAEPTATTTRANIDAMPAPKTPEEWRAQKENLLNLIDANNRANALLHSQVEANDKRAKEAEEEAQRATARTQAAWGRRIAFLCFAISTLCTIASFLPFGALIPKWAGPAGIGAAIAILVAAQLWIWVFDNLIWFSLGAAAIAAIVGALILMKSTALLRIRTVYQGAMENATSEADELKAKAAALTAELDAGVHSLGQRLRGKPAKDWDDVRKLEEAAQEKTRILRVQPSEAPIR